MELTQEQIEAGKKLIAAFMGYDVSRIVNELPIDKDGNYTTENNKWVYIHSLQYDTSLDHLKPVIDKIGRTDNDINYEPLSNVSLYSSVSDIFKEVVDCLEEFKKLKK